MENNYQPGHRRYYLTSGGRIWHVENEERIEGEAQARREILGNDFSTYEEAALAKVKLEACARTRKYNLGKRLRLDEDGNAVIELQFIMPKEERAMVVNDLELIASDGLTKEEGRYGSSCLDKPF